MELGWQSVFIAFFIYLFRVCSVTSGNSDQPTALSSNSDITTNPSTSSTGTLQSVFTQNGTKTTINTDRLNSSKQDALMLHRAFYVMLGVMAIGMLYFIVRAVRVKKAPKKKYGLLSNYDDNMEMAHLDSDDDDNTVFESRNLRR